MCLRSLSLFAVSLMSASAASLPVLPIFFEQRSPQSFTARSGDLSAGFYRDRIVFGGVTLRFPHASPAARLEGVGPPSSANYLGPGAHHTFRRFPKVAVRGLYPGIDLIVHGTGGRLEYDLELAPHASPGRVRLSFDGARLRLDRNGDLIFETASRSLRQQLPRVLQAGRIVPAHYVLLAGNQVAFRLGKNDPNLPLTIDPVLVSGSYFGGSGSDAATQVATDPQGNVYVAGRTNSADFPTAGGVGPRPTPPLITLTNGGQTIRPLPVGTEISVNAIGGSPDGNVLYAATPDGIFYSPDAGATWRKTGPLPVLTSALTFSPVVVNDISVDAADPSRAYVATTRGIFATADNGLSWRAADYGLAANSDGTVFAQSVTVDPANHLILYATTGRPNFLYRSTDAAGTWQLLNPAYPGEPPVGISPLSPIVAALAPGTSDLYVVDGAGVLLKSVNRGDTWQRLGDRIFNARVLRIDPANPSNIFVLGSLGLQVSRDGGATFSASLPAGVSGVDVTAFAWDAPTATMYIATFNALYASTDQGATWKTLPQFVSNNVHTMLAVGGRVFVALDAPQTPFLVKFDPTGTQVLYSTFFTGGLISSITGLAVDSRGSAYLTGFTNSLSSSYTTNLSPPGTSATVGGFIVKLSPDGAGLVYADLLAVTRGLSIQSIAVDSAGAAYITGQTSAPDFPTTPNALQSKLPSTPCARPSDPIFLTPANTQSWAFVSKLTADGSAYTYSTYLTGSCGSAGQGLIVNAAGEALVAGSTTSPDFPVSANAFQSAFPGRLDKTGFPNAYSVGFVARLSAAGDKVLTGTYIGGRYTSQANAIALDSSGNAYIAGTTWGIAAGGTPGAYQAAIGYHCGERIGIGPVPAPPPSNGTDAFVLVLDPALAIPRFLTYLGGSCYDSAGAIALDTAGNVWVSGTTGSTDFPLRAPFQGYSINGGFVSQLSADGSKLLFSSQSDGSALAASANGSVYVAGAGTLSTNPKVSTPSGFATTAFLGRLDPASSPTVTIDGMDHLPAYPNPFVQPSALGGAAPGEYVRIRGRNLGPPGKVESQLDSSGRLPFALAGTRVLFDDFAAPLISVQDTAIYCFVPFEVSRVAQLSVESGGLRSNTVRIGLPAANPQILAVLNQDGVPNTADRPAPLGSVVALYVTGLGQTNPGSIDGLVNSKPLPVPLAPVSVRILGQPAPAQFVAAAAGMIAGIAQVNVQIPAANYPAPAITISVNSADAALYIR